MLDLQKELQELKAKVADLESRILFPNEPVAKWQPKGGNYYISCSGVIETCGSTNDFKSHGVERATKKQAERAAVEMRRFNRLLALRDELCGNDLEVVDLFSDCKKYYVYSCHGNKEKKWSYTDCSILTSIGVYFTTAKTAQKACDMLNSGEVDL